MKIIDKMIERNSINYFRKKLLIWFNSNQRDFLWRNDNATSYQIIISEILLQKTKAETVASFLPSFLERYPTWELLNRSSPKELEDILKPIGLYRQRAKRIHNIVRDIKARNYELPRSMIELESSNLSSLYISRAFELFVLKRRAALLDVNMARLMSRYFNLETLKDLRRDTKLQLLSKQVVNVKKCKELNWAILDFSALICMLKKPKCSSCILKLKCKYYKTANPFG